MSPNSSDVESTQTQLRHIYDGYRTALLNRKYYGYKLDKYQRYNTAAEIAIAIGSASSGGIAGLAVWGSLSGKYVWLTISAAATILGVMKPILQLGRHIEKYTKLYAGHSGVYLDLKSIVEDIEVSRSLPAKLSDRYGAIRSRIVELGALQDPRPDRGLIRKLQIEVNDEIPPENLWIPSGT